MPEEGFLRRWARVKATGDDAAPQAPPAPAPPSAREPAPALTPGRWARAGDIAPAADDSAPLPSPQADADAALSTDPAGAAGADGADGADVADGAARPSPTLDDVDRLTPDSDYSIFVGQGVDKSVQRLALKKLFADPHFNVMDRLDMYMDDYNLPSPVSEAMLAQLDHARSSLRRFVDEVADLASDQAAPDAMPPENAVPNEAAPASAAHHEPLPCDTPAVARSGSACDPLSHDRDPFHRPNQQLPQGQA